MSFQKNNQPWGYLITLHKKEKIKELNKPSHTITDSNVALFEIVCDTDGLTQIIPIAISKYKIGTKSFSVPKILQNGARISITLKKQKKEYKFLTRNTSIEMKFNHPDWLIIGNKLGEGGFGEVFTAYAADTGWVSAIKIQTFSDIKVSPIREAEILLSLNHPCVIKTYEIRTSGNEMFINMEYMSGGDLKKFVNINGPHLNEQETKLIFFQIVSGVSYLHNNRICHRDLKPANILLRHPMRHTLVKISDMGFAKSELMHSAMSSLRQGGVIFVAPELKKNWDMESYNNKVDIWSLGVILYLSLSGKLPTVQNGNVSFLEKDWRSTNPYVLNLLYGMLQQLPHKRLTISEVERHTWLQDDTIKQSALALMTKKKIVQNINNKISASPQSLGRNVVLNKQQNISSPQEYVVKNDASTLMSEKKNVNVRNKAHQNSTKIPVKGLQTNYYLSKKTNVHTSQGAHNFYYENAPAPTSSRPTSMYNKEWYYYDNYEGYYDNYEGYYDNYEDYDNYRGNSYSSNNNGKKDDSSIISKALKLGLLLGIGYYVIKYIRNSKSHPLEILFYEKSVKCFNQGIALLKQLQQNN